VREAPTTATHDCSARAVAREPLATQLAELSRCRASHNCRAESSCERASHNSRALITATALTTQESLSELLQLLSVVMRGSERLSCVVGVRAIAVMRALE